MSYNQYAPGSHKLIHHIGHLNDIVNGNIVAPIHVSIWPTVVCQRKCPYCCCIKHVNKTSPELNHLDYDKFIVAIDALAKYGTKAIEFSGGGEPTLWPHFEKAVRYISDKGIKLSLITNGLTLHKLDKDVVSKFKWIRISLHNKKHVEEEIAWSSLPSDVNISCSYIVMPKEDLSILEYLRDFGDKSGKIIRIGMERPCSEDDENRIREVVESLGGNLTFSVKAVGAPKACYMAWVRGAITWDGSFIPCPSIQLTEEFRGEIPRSFKLCNIEDLEQWLTSNRPKDLGYRCKFCNCGKENNDLIYSLFNGGEDVEFV